MRKSEYTVRYFDGERPLAIEGVVRVTGKVVFQSDDGSVNFTISYDKIVECRKNNNRVTVVLPKGRQSSIVAAKTLVCDDLEFYRDLIERIPTRGIEKVPFMRSLIGKSIWAVIVAALFAAAFYTLMNDGYRLVPLRVEKKLGDNVRASALKFYHESKDTKNAHKAESIVAKLKKKNSAYNYTVTVVDSPDVNAFAAPGGNLIIFSELFSEADDNELAGVLAHEMAHVENRHSLRQLIRMMGFSFVLNFAFGPAGAQAQGIDALNNGVSLAAAFTYSREYELDADREAALTLKKKGLDPRGLVEFLRKMDKMYGSSEPPVYLSTHPKTVERIKILEKIIAR